jgi:hypothetical protein
MEEFREKCAIVAIRAQSPQYPNPVATGLRWRFAHVWGS